MTDRGGRPVEGEQDGQAVELLAPSLLLGPLKLVCRDVDPTTQPLSLTRGAQVPHLGVVVAGSAGVGRGDDAVLAPGGRPEERVHAASVRAARCLLGRGGDRLWMTVVSAAVLSRVPPHSAEPATARRHRRARSAEAGGRWRKKCRPRRNTVG